MEKHDGQHSKLVDIGSIYLFIAMTAINGAKVFMTDPENVCGGVDSSSIKPQAARNRASGMISFSYVTVHKVAYVESQCRAQS
jgi:hypothetical protein